MEESRGLWLLGGVGPRAVSRRRRLGGLSGGVFVVRRGVIFGGVGILGRSRGVGWRGAIAGGTFGTFGRGHCLLSC